MSKIINLNKFRKQNQARKGTQNRAEPAPPRTHPGGAATGRGAETKAQNANRRRATRQTSGRPARRAARLSELEDSTVAVRETLEPAKEGKVVLRRPRQNTETSPE